MLAALAGCDLDRRLLYFPDHNRPDIQAVRLAQARAVDLRTEDGLDLLAWWVPAADPQPVIAYFHGNGGNVAYRAERLRQFAAMGFGALFLEYRGYGGNKGSPSEEGFYADARAALAFLAREGVPPHRLVLYGESLGCGVAVRIASERPVGAIVLEAPYTSIEAVAQHHYPLLPVKLLLRDRFDAAARIKAVAAPILMLHGERDEIVPVALGRALFAAAAEPKEAWFEPDGGHHDLRQHGAFTVVADFLRRRIRR